MTTAIGASPGRLSQGPSGQSGSDDIGARSATGPLDRQSLQRSLTERPAEKPAVAGAQRDDSDSGREQGRLGLAGVRSGQAYNLRSMLSGYASVGVRANHSSGCFRSSGARVDTALDAYESVDQPRIAAALRATPTARSGLAGASSDPKLATALGRGRSVDLSPFVRRQAIVGIRAPHPAKVCSACPTPTRMSLQSRKDPKKWPLDMN